MHTPLKSCHPILDKFHTINDMQIPISGFQNEATIIHPQFCIPPKTPPHLTKIHQTQLHTVKPRIKDWNLY